MNLDIVINGVGGQGVVLASRVIAETAMECGLEVRTSETIGMAQKEGSVISQVRIGKNLQGALIPDKSADFLLSFELAETIRGLQKVKSTGKVIANSHKIVPVSVTLNKTSYNEEEILAYLEKEAPELFLFDAHSLAVKAGNYKTVNMVLLGVLSTFELPFAGEKLLDTALKMLPEKVHEVNKKAFELGREVGEGK